MSSSPLKIQTSDNDNPRSPIIKKQSSSLSQFFSKSQQMLSSKSLALSPTHSRKEKIKPAAIPPSSLSRQELQDFLVTQGTNPSLEGVIRLGNMCYLDIEGHGLHPRSPEMCYHSAVLLQWVNNLNGPLNAVDQNHLAFSHYQAWLNSGIIAEVSWVVNI
jgi:hypothetical protein